MKLLCNLNVIWKYSWELQLRFVLHLCNITQTSTGLLADKIKIQDKCILPFLTLPLKASPWSLLYFSPPVAVIVRQRSHFSILVHFFFEWDSLIEFFCEINLGNNNKEMNTQAAAVFFLLVMMKLWISVGQAVNVPKSVSRSFPTSEN